MRLEVQGHASEDGPEQYNQVLSQRRADAVVRALVKRGVSRDRLEARGYGASRAVAGNANETERRRNRRVEFLVTR